MNLLLIEDHADIAANNTEFFEGRVRAIAEEKNKILKALYGAEPLDAERVIREYRGYAGKLKPFVTDAVELVNGAIDAGKRVLFEGAQGSLLDIDFGTYPFVTSSNSDACGISAGTGVPPKKIKTILGVAKAYCTRVGEGPFPTEIEGPDQARMRELGGEYGTTTGRERRCGWLDLVALRFAVRVNGLTSLALTKLDVLSAFSELPVCVAYRLPDGSETEEFPGHQSDFHHARPVYRTLPGWAEPLDEVDGLDGLPERARDYVDFVSDALEVEVCMVGTGPDRERVLTSRAIASVAG